MTTASATCPPSPRTEKRILEKQRRREMVMNGDIADKLYRPDLFNLDLQYSQSKPNNSPITSSPEKSANGKTKERSEDGLNKMRIEKVMGSYADFQLRNFHRMPGISFQNSLTPSPTTASKNIKDKRKMVAPRDRDPMEASSGLVTSSSGHPSCSSGHATTSNGHTTTSSGHATTSSGHTTTSSGHTTTSSGQATSNKASLDLREKINKRRDSRGPVSHKTLKDRVGEQLFELTKMPGCKQKGEDTQTPSQSGDERRNKQEKRRQYHGSSSSERHRTSSDRRESSGDRRESSSDRRESSERRPLLSGERRRSSQEGKRSGEERRKHTESRKRPYTAGSGSDLDSDSTLSTSDLFRLTNIFNIMRCSGDLSPLPVDTTSDNTPTARSTKQEEVDSDDEELDLKSFEEKMKIAGVLPSSPGPPDVSCSDIDSDQDYDEFPLSKSTMEVSIKEEVTSDHAPETKVKLKETPKVKLEDKPKVKLEDKPKVKLEEKPKVKLEEKPKVKLEDKPKVKLEEKPKVKLEEKPRVKLEKARLKVEESVKVKPENVDTKAATACIIPALDTSEVEKKDQKPFVAVNPRMKNSAISKEEVPSMLGDLLANIRDNQTVTEEGVVDIRRLLSQGTQFNLLLSFGFDKVSTRPLQNPDIISAVRSYRCKRGESELSSNEEEGKPQEKPSCKVPCIPRTEHVTRVPPEQRGSASPDRGQSPDPVYHRDKREYGYQPKRRRITREPTEYEQFPHPYFPNGIPTALAIPSYAYLVQQPRNLMPPTRAQCTFVSRDQMDDEKSDLDKALTRLDKFEVYNEKGHTLKKTADNATHNQTMKIRKYMEASIQYVYAALSAHQKQDFQSCYIWLHNTANIIDFCMRPRSNHGLDVRIQDKRLAVLCLLLVSHIQRTIWMNRKTEYVNLQKSCNQVIRHKQKEEQGKSLNTTNKSSDSPTPSPASSLVSMASYTGTEVLDTNMTETVPSRLIKDMSKYFKLAHALNSWVDYWEEAASLAQHSLVFFNNLDEQVCPISSTTHLYTVARYVGQGLQNLDMDTS